MVDALVSVGIGADTGLSPFRRYAITWTNGDTGEQFPLKVESK